MKFGLVESFFKVIPIKDSVFLRKDTPDIKLTRELVSLNYEMFSPYNNGDFVFYQDGKSLLLWFTAFDVSKEFYIPESLLFYMKAQKENTNNAFVFKKDPKEGCSIAVIKEGSLVSQVYSKDGCSIFPVLKREFSLKGDIVSLEIKKGDAIFDSISLKDVLTLFKFLNLNYKKIYRYIYEEVKVLLILLFLVLILYNFTLFAYTSSQVSKKANELEVLKKQNKDVKKKFKELEEAHAFFSKFISKELNHPYLSEVIYTLSEIFYKNETSVNTYRQAGKIVNVWVKTPSVSNLVNSLMSSGYFDNVKVLKSSSSGSSGMENAELELTLRAVKNVKRRK